MQKTSGDTIDPLVNRLRAVAQTSPELRVIARLYEAILPLTGNAQFESVHVELDQSEITRALEDGEPLMTLEKLAIDIPAMETLMAAMARSVEQIGTAGTRRRWQIWGSSAETWTEEERAGLAELQRSAGRIRESIETGRLAVAGIMPYVTGGDFTGFECAVASLQLDAQLLWALSHHVLRPVLFDIRSQLPQKIGETGWQRGYCYVCGATATLAELQDNDQVKHLRCGQCGADWHVPRIQCLQCGNENHATQRTLYVDGSEHRRIEACDQCNSYLKVITAFSPTLPELVTVEDLATLDLDFVAQQHGYTKPH